MPGKQGTLKLVKPDQQRLDKWFSGQNGAGPSSSSSQPEPQQSKLKLQPADSNGRRAAPAKSEKNVKNEDADVDMEDVENQDEAKVSSSNGRDYVAVEEEEEEEEDDDDDDAPRSRKRRRTSPPAETKLSSRAKTARVEVKSKSKDEEIKVDKPVPVKQQKATDEDEEPLLDDDEDKPEIDAKARKQVLLVLKDSGTDPYPDWKAGEPTPYAALCTTFHKIEMTTKRLEILAHCSLFLRQVLRLTPGDLLETVLLMTGKLGADYTGIELGIGESLIMKAIGESTGRSLAVIKTDQNEIGDLGLVAAKSRSKQSTMFKPKPLTVNGVFKGLKDIAMIEGHGSQGRKVDGIKKLLSAADSATAGAKVDITNEKGGPSEAKYIVRTLEGKLRLGLAEKSVLVALAQAIVFHHAEVAAASAGEKVKPPTEEELASGETIVKTIYSELPSYEIIIPALIAKDYDTTELRSVCRLQPGIPLKPMLAKPTKSITEVLDRFEGKHFTCEYKYDGERAQIHFVAHDSAERFATSQDNAAGKSEKGIANVFSRNSEDLSKKYPDILAKLPSWVKDGTKSFVLDCESVAWDVEEKKVLPFQQLQTRKRKDVKAEDIKVKVCVFAFDLLYLNGEALVNKTLRERRELLHTAFEPVDGEFAYAVHGDAEDVEAIQTLLDESMKAGCEGLMVKMLDGAASSYEPSKRSQNWLKVKKDYLSGVGDSLDLVVLGAYFGRGKRTSVYGAFLLACWNEREERYESICNIGTGFSEEVLADLHKRLAPEVISRPKPFYEHPSGAKDQPDVWFEPRFVWEVKTADLTLSPRYRAAGGEVGGDGKGVSLRFPRFIKEREDKTPEQATTSRAVADMYRRQESVTKQKGPAVDDDFEY